MLETNRSPRMNQLMKIIAFLKPAQSVNGMLLRRFACAMLALVCFAPATLDARRGPKIENPDFTKGDPVPKDAPHDWNLGATGARGWMYIEKMETTKARQVYVTKVAKGSPADGVLKVGDVILGVSGKAFEYDPRPELGKALTHAESSAGKGKLSLMLWRQGKQGEVTVKLPVMGDYSKTAPYDCEKSKLILKNGCESLAKRMEEKSYRENPISKSLNGLALLASGEKKYMPLIKREVEWASKYSATSMMTWHYGYAIMLLSEYTIATGDKTYMPGLTRLVMESVNGQSKVGSWGHKFSDPNGRLVGYGMMNSPGLTLTISLALAREAGVKDPKLDLAIDRSATMLRFYKDKGAVPYGDHAAWTQTHEDNGKCGMAAVLFNLLEEKGEATYFTWMSTAAHGNVRDTGHTGNFFNVLWSLPAVAQAGPQASGAWMDEFGSWYFDLARTWEGRFVHLGPPQAKNDSYARWDATGGYLLAYSRPLKHILLTGKAPNLVDPLTYEQAEKIIDDGRGWTNGNRNEFYDNLTTDELLKRLASWSPVVRERAAMALGRKKYQDTDTIIPMLSSSSYFQRLGACQALVHMRGAAAPAIDALLGLLDDPDLWIRIKAAEALASIGQPAHKTIPRLLEVMCEEDLENDPRGMQQRYMSGYLFGRRGLLNGTMNEVDRKLLFNAVRAGLKNEDGRARSAYSEIYNKFSFEDLRPLLPEIHEAIITPSPSGVMFASGIRMSGLQLLSKNHVEEGLAASMHMLKTQNKWGSQKRIHEILECMLRYGAHVKPLIPELEAFAAEIQDGEKGFPAHLSKQKAGDIRAAIKKVEAMTEKPELTQIK